MRKNEISNMNNEQNGNNNGVSNILNMLSMMNGKRDTGEASSKASDSHDEGEDDVNDSMQYVGGQPLYGTTDANQIPQSESSDTSTPSPLSRNALRFADMIRRHDEAIKRIDKNNENK